MSLHNWNNKKIIVENTSSYMVGQDFDIVEEARGKKIADPLRAKLMGMEDIRDLKGTMTPRYFATKVIRFLQKENPELDIENLSDEDVQNAINVIANVSKPLASRPDVKITTRERGAAKEGLKKGDTGFETLQLNLGGDTILRSEGEVGENDLYTVVSDGLKYRVTLNSFKGQKINLDDISQDDVVSVVIVKPSEMETVDKFGGEIDLGQREKLVADYPEGEEEGKDDIDTIIDKIMSMKVNASNPYVRHDPREVDPDMPLDIDDRFDPDMEIGPEDGENCAMSDEENNPKQVHPLDKDLDDDGEIIEYGKARKEDIANAMKKERERAGQAHARAVADHYEDENGHQKEIEDERKAQDKEKQQEIEAEIRASRGDEDAEIDAEKADLDNDGELSEYEKKRGKAIADAIEKSKQKDDSDEDELEEDEQIALSSQQINQMMINKYRQNLQSQYGHERLNRHGY
tara:strand:+ start:3223 stop:4605 length:1383 start_codon:yes stop_codon:yes gene_type:complete